MANYVFNIAKGRVVEFFNRVDSNDPANSAIILVPCSASDTEANAQDADTLTAALATAINEQTAGGWGRVTLSDTQIAAIAVDDTNNRFPASIPQTSMGSPTVGNDTTGLLVCYDSDTTGGTDANIIPLVHLDMAVTADGNEVIINPGDILRAS
jgi:hypothetical protein